MTFKENMAQYERGYSKALQDMLGRAIKINIIDLESNDMVEMEAVETCHINEILSAMQRNRNTDQ